MMLMAYVISLAMAIQRAGHGARLKSAWCHRVYTEEQFRAMQPQLRGSSRWTTQAMARPYTHQRGSCSPPTVHNTTHSCHASRIDIARSHRCSRMVFPPVPIVHLDFDLHRPVLPLSIPYALLTCGNLSSSLQALRLD